jgi:hypothetical protein
MAGLLIKGALVEFIPTFLVPVPNVIVFQFNPETMTHTWNQTMRDTQVRPGEGSNPLAVKGVPGESFSFTLIMDSDDVIARGAPVLADVARVSGLYTRLAALEILQFPAPPPPSTAAGSATVSTLGDGLVGKVNGPPGAGTPSPTGGAQPATPTKVSQVQLPMVLFVWGPGRILPVRVSSLTITEKLYDRFLNPIHAEAQISLDVLTLDDLKPMSGLTADIGKVAYYYNYAQKLSKAAAANLANAADVLGMLPL